MKINKTSVRKAFKGWLSSGGCEVPQSYAIDTALDILESGEGAIVYTPDGGLFKVDGSNRTIVRQLNGKEREVFQFEKEEQQ